MSTDLATLLLKVDASQVEDAVGELDKLTAAGKRAEAVNRKSTQTMSHHAQALKRDYIDLGNVLSGPTSPFVAPAKQAPAASAAMRTMATAAGALGGVIGGVLVTGAMAAVAALGELILKSRNAESEINALVEKMKEAAKQAKLNDEANRIWKSSLDGVEESLRQNQKALEDHIRASKTFAQRQYEDAAAATEKAQAIRKQNLALLESLKAQVMLTAATNIGGASGAAAASANLQQRILQIEGMIARAEDVIATGQAQMARAVSMRFREIMETEPDFMKLPRKKRERKPELQREIGSEFGLDEAKSIVTGAGGRWTSGLRSAADNKRVGGTANSFHLFGQAIDIAKGAGKTLNDWVAAFRAKGARILEALDEGDHFHIAFKAMTAAQEEAARATKKAAEDAINRQQAFQSEDQRLDEEILRARGQLAQGSQAQAAFAVQILQIEQANYEKALDRLVADRKLEAADAERLKIKQQQITAERAKAINLERQLAAMEQESDALFRQRQYLIEDAAFAEEEATTTARRRELQLQILDLTYLQKEAALRDLKARLELAGKMEEAARVQEQINRLPTEKEQDRSRIKDATRNPLEEWARGIPKTEAEIRESLQRIQAQGLEGLTSAITNVITGTQSLKSAFKDLARSIIADIIQMTVRMLIFRAVSSVLGGGFGGGIGAGVPGGAGGGAAGPVGMASGGSFQIMGNGGTDRNILSLNGQPLARVSKGETGLIIPKKAGNLNTRQAANEQQRVVVEFVGFTDKMNVQIREESAGVMARAAPAMMRATQANIVRTLNRPRLNG